MLLNINDLGISLTLASEGIRESQATTVYQQQLRRLSRLTDSPIILDIGANIGYYALMVPATIDESHTIAIEPESSNIDILRKNININNYQDQCTIRQHAVGANVDKTDLYLSQRSNTHTLKPAVSYVDTVDVSVKPISVVLEEENIGAEEINVVRMDIEGYEAAAFAGMRSVLNSDSPLIINVEIHVPILNNEEMERILSWLKRDNVTIEFLKDDSKRIETVEEIPNGRWVHVIASKNMS